MRTFLPVLALAAATTCLHAQGPNTVFFSASVMTGFQWHAATNAGAGTSGSCAVGAAPVQYFAAPFWTDTTASTYTLDLYYPSFQAGFVYLYADQFVPQDPCNGIVAFGFAPLASLHNITLDANRQYVFVTSEDVLFGGGGWFQAQITGPQGTNVHAGTLLPSFNSSVASISLWQGGSQPWSLDAGAAQAGRSYLVLGSLTGTVPGTTLPGLPTIPLNHDFWFDFTVSAPNSAILVGSLGSLDGAGQAQVGGLTLPSGLPSWLAGLVVNHAYVVLDPSGGISFVSNPLPLQITN
jgi:hypothetical protein